MIIGLARMIEFLGWYEKDTSIELLIQNAIRAYRHKFGTSPNYCSVNSGQYNDKLRIDGIEIVGAKNTLKDHVLIGVK
jgi:hypothetical protein